MFFVACFFLLRDFFVFDYLADGYLLKFPRPKITLGFFEKTQGNDSQHIENFPKITF